MGQQGRGGGAGVGGEGLKRSLEMGVAGKEGLQQVVTIELGFWG